MTMVDVIYMLPTGGLMVQAAGGLGPKVGSHLALLCIHHVNRVNSCNSALRRFPFRCFPLPNPKANS